jgi:hypothetical protein
LHGPRRKQSLSIFGKMCLQRGRIAMEVTRLLLVYSLLRECVYRVVALQWTSILTSLIRISGVTSQYITFCIKQFHICKTKTKLGQSDILMLCLENVSFIRNL